LLLRRFLGPLLRVFGGSSGELWEGWEVGRLGGMWRQGFCGVGIDEGVRWDGGIVGEGGDGGVKISADNC
jgi:hypothetical protein